MLDKMTGSQRRGIARKTDSTGIKHKGMIFDVRPTRNYLLIFILNGTMMIKLRQNLLLLTAMIMLAYVLPACKKGKNDSGNKEQPGKIPGMGEMAGKPDGTLYQLPGGITLAGPIKGGGCDTVYESGSGNYVQVCVGLQNNSNRDTVIILPAGLIFIADDAEDYQNGIVIQETRIILKAGKITWCGVGSYCINASKSSSSSSMTYQMGPVTNSSLMNELIGMLKNKKISEADYPPDADEYYEAVSAVQGAVWSITDGAGITSYEREELAKIANK